MFDLGGRCSGGWAGIGDRTDKGGLCQSSETICMYPMATIREASGAQVVYPVVLPIDVVSIGVTTVQWAPAIRASTKAHLSQHANKLRKERQGRVDDQRPVSQPHQQIWWPRRVMVDGRLVTAELRIPDSTGHSIDEQRF